MAVICLVDGGSTEVTRYAAQSLLNYPDRNSGQIGYIACHRNLGSSSGLSTPDVTAAMVPSHHLIESIRRLQPRYDHVIVDASGTSDQTIALSVALSDFALTPLCLDEPEYASFMHAIDLVKRVANNLKRPEKHCVFLTTRRRKAQASTVLQIAGLLAIKGLASVSIPLYGRKQEADGSPPDGDGLIETGNASFAYSVFDLVDRQLMPILRQRRFIGPDQKPTFVTRCQTQFVAR